MRKSLLFALLAAAPLAAQEQQSAPAANASVNAVRGMWQIAQNFLVRSAEQVPESLYAFAPTPEVRSFGQLVGHVANSQYFFCAAAVGEESPSKTDIEKTVTTKAELVQALKDAATYCERAYSQSDADAAGPIKTRMFGPERNRMFALVINASHNMEHYGNIVTYMRIKGMVPPSTQQQQGQ